MYNGSSPFVDPAFQTSLNKVGLGGVTAIVELSVSIIHVAQIPRNIWPVFLPGLTTIGDTLGVLECVVEDVDTAQCADGLSRPVTPRLVDLPGLTNLSRIDYRLFVVNTAFTDMMPLRGLRCPPDHIQLVNLMNLSSLHGWENVYPWTKDVQGPSIFIYTPSPANISALRPMALCDEHGNTTLSPNSFAGGDAPTVTFYGSYCPAHDGMIQVRPICTCEDSNEIFAGHCRFMIVILF